MSDFIYKIISEKIDYDITEEIIHKVKDYINLNIIAENVECKKYEQVVFVDCGENLELISCPKCNNRLSLDWWAKRMENASKNAFSNLLVTLPCCKEQVSLNDLNYHFICGFSKFEVDIINPENSLNMIMIQDIEKLLCEKVKIIECCY